MVVYYQVQAGHTADSTLEVIAENGIDLVVTGATGGSRLDRRLVGSTTEQVV